MANSCYSRGNINAPIMIIGQAPAKDEVHHSCGLYNDRPIPMPIPLCGAAGQELHRILIWLGLMEGDFYLTNIVKEGTFKPGSNYVRPPTEKEILDYRDDLLLEIKKVNPRLIIPLGKEALWSLCYHEKQDLDEMRIGINNGKLHTIKLEWFDKTEKIYPILPLYHPSAILRDKDGENGYKQAVAMALTEHKELIGEKVNRLLL